MNENWLLGRITDVRVTAEGLVLVTVTVCVTVFPAAVLPKFTLDGVTCTEIVGEGEDVRLLLFTTPAQPAVRRNRLSAKMWQRNRANLDV